MTVYHPKYPSRITLRAKAKPKVFRGLRPVCVLKYRTGQHKGLFRRGYVVYSEWLDYRGILPSGGVIEITNSEMNTIRLACSIREGMCKVVAGALPKEIVSALKKSNPIRCKS